MLQKKKCCKEKRELLDRLGSLQEMKTDTKSSNDDKGKEVTHLSEFHLLGAFSQDKEHEDTTVQGDVHLANLNCKRRYNQSGQFARKNGINKSPYLQATSSRRVPLTSRSSSQG